VYRLGLASTQNNLGLLWSRTGALAPAERALHSALEILGKLVADFPGVPDYRYKLAATRLNLATLLEKADPTAAQTAVRAALSDCEALAARFPGVPEYGFAEGNASYCLGDLLAREGHLAEAGQALEQAVKRLQAALEANPRNPSYVRALGLAYRDQAEVFRQTRKFAELAAAAEAMPRVAPDDPDAYRVAASDLAQAVELVTKNDQVSEAARTSLQQSYGQKAVELLRTAFERGLLVDPRELDDPALNAIRDRDDFRRLERTVKPAPKPLGAASPRPHAPVRLLQSFLSKNTY
jgi:tetratricopeptide (TPR) repeat protein